MRQIWKSAGVIGDDSFREGVVSGFLLILFSELGDKTFFIALLLALKQSQGLVFAGTFGALAVMTVISVSPVFTLAFWIVESDARAVMFSHPARRARI